MVKPVIWGEKVQFEENVQFYGLQSFFQSLSIFHMKLHKIFFPFFYYDKYLST